MRSVLGIGLSMLMFTGCLGPQAGDPERDTRAVDIDDLILAEKADYPSLDSLIGDMCEYYGADSRRCDPCQVAGLYEDGKCDPYSFCKARGGDPDCSACQIRDHLRINAWADYCKTKKGDCWACLCDTVGMDHREMPETETHPWRFQCVERQGEKQTCESDEEESAALQCIHSKNGCYANYQDQAARACMTSPLPPDDCKAEVPVRKVAFDSYCQGKDDECWSCRCYNQGKSMTLDPDALASGEGDKYFCADPDPADMNPECYPPAAENCLKSVDSCIEQSQALAAWGCRDSTIRPTGDE